jgi:hypothetical protein
MRRVGEMMKATGPRGTNERSDGGRPQKTSTKSELVSKPTLAEIGLTKKESALASKAHTLQLDN